MGCRKWLAESAARMAYVYYLQYRSELKVMSTWQVGCSWFFAPGAGWVCKMQIVGYELSQVSSFQIRQRFISPCCFIFLGTAIGRWLLPSTPHFSVTIYSFVG